MRILITGFSGFVARHFLEFLYTEKIECQVYGIDIKEPSYDYQQYEDIMKVKYRELNLLDIAGLKELFTDFTPDYILHLASFSSVAYSWQHPAESFINNTNIFLNLITVVKEFNVKCRVLSIGSSEEYGNVTKEDLPLKERQPLRPISPYAVARVSQEMLSKVFVDSYHLDIVITRSFNHIGPYQDERFVISSFIRRIKDLSDAGVKEGTIETGDITIVRDFVDVRDVVRAYYLLLTRGRAGEVYNICSGHGNTLNDVIQLIGKQLSVKVTGVTNLEFVRPNDNKAIVGSSYKIMDELGWKPEITMEQTIADMIKATN